MSQALIELGISNFELEGTPTTETEFNECFTKITGFDEHRTIIRSTNPDDFGVTWSEVKAKYDELVAAEPMKLLREERDRRLAETDWWASSDLTMTQAQTDYRQALRDITNTYSSMSDDGFAFPTKPTE